jgi:hypothetical protein
MDNIRLTMLPPAKMVIAQVGIFATSVILVLIIFVLGMLISKLIIKNGITGILKSLKFDDLAHSIELDAMLSKGGITLKLSELVGIICYWLSLLVTIVVALNAVGLTVAADLMQKIVLFVPNIIAAVFILIVGMFVSVLLKNIVKVTASNAGIQQANLLSNMCQVVIMVFVIAVALEQLQIGVRIIDLTISIILGSFGLGFALAFGLGCKDIVGKWVHESLTNLKK